MKVPESQVYVLGCFERRITLWAQQHRALNLIYALHYEGLLAPGKRVAVVGGGVGGLTAAAAAQQKGCNTMLFEQQGQLLHLLDGNHTRWIHPRIIDWPGGDSEVAHAGLPLLDWNAGSAGEVSEEILDGFQRAAVGCSVHTSAKVELPTVGRGAKPKLKWNGITKDFDVVILAVGFGLERTVPSLPLVSYWRDDSLHQHVLGVSPRSFLVSGCGDGGLIDFLRLCIKRFRHERLVHRLLNSVTLDPVKAELLQIENELQRIPLADQPAFIKTRYRSLPVPSIFHSELAQHLREDTKVSLCGKNALPFDARSSALHRFLAWQILTLGRVEYIDSGVAHVAPLGPKYEVHFIGKPARIFDHVVIRHGPEPVVQQFSCVSRHLAKLQKRVAPDEARCKMWSDDFYVSLPLLPSMDLTPPPEINADAAKRRIDEVFSIKGEPPRYTFVPPKHFDELKRKLAKPGRALIVSGPTGIGKTITVKKALRELMPPDGVPLYSGHHPPDRAQVDAILSKPLVGHLVVDDVRAFDQTTRDRLIAEIFRIHQSGTVDAKITIIDGGAKERSLTDEYPGLITRVDSHPLQRQPAELIGRLLYAGQKESNLRFIRPEQIVRAARGSYLLAQQLCEKAAIAQEIDITPATVQSLPIEMDQIIEEMMWELGDHYQRCARTFAAIDQSSPRPGLCLLLLFHLVRTQDDELQILDIEKRYPDFAVTFAWLKAGKLAERVADKLKSVLHYDDATGVLTLIDPRFGFYLQNLSWVELANKVSLRVGIKPNGDLVLP